MRNFFNNMSLALIALSNEKFQKTAMFKIQTILILPLFLIFFSTSFTQAQIVKKGLEPANQEPPCVEDPCPCQGLFTEIKVYYFGPDGVDIDVYGNNGLSILITSFVGVNKGDLLTIDGTGSPSGSLYSKTYLQVTNGLGETCITKIDTKCPTNAWPGALDDLKVVGKSFGDFVVYSRTDQGNNTECTIGDTDQDWHVGGNIVDASNNTMGTRNNEDVTFISNDTPRGVITKTGFYGINTQTPAAQLEVNGDAIVQQTLDVNGIARMNAGVASTNPSNGSLIVTGGTGISEDLNVGHDADVSNDARVGNNLDVGNDAAVGNDLAVTNDATVGHDLEVFNNTRTGNNLDVGNSADIGNDLDVADDGTFGGNLRVSSNPALSINVNTNLSGNVITSAGSDLYLRSSSNDLFINHSGFDGKVGIGTTNVPDNLPGGIDISDYKLYVQGGILADEVRVRTGWADYVFEADYQLPSLDEVALFIKNHKHLPNVPSAAQIEAGGLNLADAAVLQQEKIEELFLYIIELNESVKELTIQNQALQSKLNKLEKQQ